MTAFNNKGLILISTLIGLSPNTYAACSRDDVDYYLTKGFTTDQITTLCAPASDSPTHIPDKKPGSVTKTSEQPISNDHTELFFREAIKARNVVLAHNSLAYTLKVCIKYGEEDLYGFAPKACPNVRFELVLNGLEVKEPVKKLFFNPDEIEVTGNITRNIIDGLEKYTAEEQTLILNKLESGNKTSIPVRDDISIDRVFQTLEQLTL